MSWLFLPTCFKISLFEQRSNFSSANFILKRNKGEDDEKKRVGINFGKIKTN